MVDDEHSCTRIGFRGALVQFVLVQEEKVGAEGAPAVPMAVATVPLLDQVVSCVSLQAVALVLVVALAGEEQLYLLRRVSPLHRACFASSLRLGLQPRKLRRIPFRVLDEVRLDGDGQELMLVANSRACDR